MKASVLSALVVAMGSGLAIGAQSTLINFAGRLLGPVRTGLVVNFAGGVIAGIVLIALTLFTQAMPSTAIMKPVIPIAAAAGTLGLGIVAGIAYSLGRVGVAAGFATIIFGQMLVAVLVDTQGWGGAVPIPLRPERLVGLGLLVVGAWLVLPRG